MTPLVKAAIVGTLVVAVIAVFAVKNQPAPVIPSPVAPQAVTLPRLLDLGADKCIPCKMMQPVLADLRNEHKGKLQVDFIDVWKDTAGGDKYKVESIPTQIFFDAKGQELYRHVGFYGKDKIEAKMKELGFRL